MSTFEKVVVIDGTYTIHKTISALCTSWSLLTGRITLHHRTIRGLQARLLRIGMDSIDTL